MQMPFHLSKPKTYPWECRETPQYKLLTRGNTVLGEEVFFSGGAAGVAVDRKVVFKKAVSYLASAIILVHNHPSGQLRPSKTDLDITRKMVEVGKLLEVVVHDHLIISHKRYYSFADDGLV